MLFSLLLLVWLGGCASTVHTLPLAETSRLPAPLDKPATVSPRTSSGSAVFTSGGQELTDLERLAQLWQRRTQNSAVSDYPIGPGDVLEISVPAMEEIKDRTVRVSGDGTIALPLIGTIRASRLTEEGLREEIRRRLEADYMYNPQVNIFVREYRSRQVAVIGAVEKPGLYSLASETDTLLDTISLAGGMTKEAASRINFIPAEPVEEGKVKELASALPIQLVSKDSSPLLLKRADPIVIDLKSLTKGGNQLYLSLPARPGDVIMVPGSGDVLLEGWVAKPGSYKITPGLTVLGAVVAAGGPLFAADTSTVKIVRTGKEGEKIFFLADLEEIKRGEKPDISIQEGDVIEVSYSALKIGPYSFYSFFTDVFRVGASVPFY